MSIFEAIVLGVVQGLTEFIPISSTAHVRIIPAMFGWNDPGAPFTAVSQLGTLAAVLLYYRGTVRGMSVSVWLDLRNGTPLASDHSRMAWWIALATIPIIVLGLLLKTHIETSFRSLYVISFSLILLAVLLIIAERSSRFNRASDSLRWYEVLVIGVAQAVALIPGSSRSGTTITAGMFLNLRREDAASFSFLLSIPAVALSGFYQLFKLRHELAGVFGISLVITVIVSGIVGYASIHYLLRYLRTHSTYIFVLYRIALGILILVLMSRSILEP